MSPNAVLRIDNLRVENFRCFTSCEISLEPDLTVIVAENAQGKTAILNAISIALAVFVRAISKQNQTPKFESEDIHLIRDSDGKMKPASTVSFEAAGQVDGEPVLWSRSRNSEPRHSRNTTRDTSQLCKVAARLAKQSSTHDLVLPIVAFYGTSRLCNDKSRHVLSWRQSPMDARLTAYQDALSPTASFNSFVAWYEQMAEALHQATSKSYPAGVRPELLLTAVRTALANVLKPTDWSILDWDFPPINKVTNRPIGKGRLVVEHQERGRLPFEFLSDGVRNVGALVGDLARRCVLLNPQFGEEAAKLTPGVILIDEVDLHLHPHWQQLIVELLDDAFPAMQKIYTTHSPQVLTTVNARCIRRLLRTSDGYWLTTDSFLETKGIESSAALNDVMGVNQVPPVDESEWRREYISHIEDGTHLSPEVVKLREKLSKLYGTQHPIILDFDRLIRFQSFKRRQSESKE